MEQCVAACLSCGDLIQNMCLKFVRYINHISILVHCTGSAILSSAVWHEQQNFAPISIQKWFKLTRLKCNYETCSIL